MQLSAYKKQQVCGGCRQPRARMPSRAPPPCQTRWAQGSIQTALLLVPQVWRSSVPLVTKLTSTIHMLGYFCHPFMLANLGLTLLMCVLDSNHEPLLHPLLLLCSAMGPPLVVVVAQLHLRSPQRLLLMPLLLLMHHGISLSNTHAVLQGVCGHRGVFERTPKFGDAAMERTQAARKRDESWVKSNYARSVRSALSVTGEAVLCGLLLAVLVYRSTTLLLDSLNAWLFFFLASYVYIIVLSAMEFADSGGVDEAASLTMRATVAAVCMTRRAWAALGRTRPALRAPPAVLEEQALSAEASPASMETPDGMSPRSATSEEASGESESEDEPAADDLAAAAEAQALADERVQHSASQVWRRTAPVPAF